MKKVILKKKCFWQSKRTSKLNSVVFPAANFLPTYFSHLILRETHAVFHIELKMIFKLSKKAPVNVEVLDPTSVPSNIFSSEA